jgi:rhodanese-related sulfurtransferase
VFYTLDKITNSLLIINLISKIMKKRVLILFVAVIIPLFTMISCREYEEASYDEYAILTEYMKTTGKDFANIVDATWVKAGSAINVNVTDYSVPDYYVMDIRAAADYDNGHIKGAVNVPLANILTAAPNAGTKPILVVCYTGQTAARAVCFLRLSGYTAHVLKWGMAGWHAAFQAKWTSNVAQLNNANWVTTGAPATVSQFTTPVLNTGKTTGAEILKARIEFALSNTNWTVSKTDVLANPTNYFINNKWGQADWDTYGHITSAYRIDVADGLTIDGLNKFNPAAPTLVTYCYTGQTSSITSAWLNVVGFDNAKSLSFGANGIIYDNMKNGSVAIRKSTWLGDLSGSTNNFGYYKTDGTYVAPL